MLLSAGNRLSRKQLARLNRARHRRQLKSDTKEVELRLAESRSSRVHG
jgi:hypothetical protein